MPELLFTPEIRPATLDETMKLYAAHRGVLSDVIFGNTDLARVPEISIMSLTRGNLDSDSDIPEEGHTPETQISVPTQWLLGNLADSRATNLGVQYARTTLETIENVDLGWTPAYMTGDDEERYGVPETLDIGLRGRHRGYTSELFIDSGAEPGEEIHGWVSPRFQCYRDGENGIPALLDAEREVLSAMGDERALSYNEYQVVSWIAGALQESLAPKQ